jgi:hypothetical protein
MNTYLYRGSLYCETCARGNQVHLAELGYNPDCEDSDIYPQECGEEGGGMADCPVLCTQCDQFLENDLTRHGETHVRSLIQKYDERGEGDPDYVNELREFYAEVL